MKQYRVTPKRRHSMAFTRSIASLTPSKYPNSSIREYSSRPMAR